MSYQPNYKYVPPFEFNFLTRFYDLILTLMGFGKQFRRKILHAVEVKDTDQILDVGCGTGVFLELLKRAHPTVSVIGIDPDQTALGLASNRLQQYPNVKLITGFAESIPLPDNSINLVFSTLAFHHMPNEAKQKAIPEIYRVLKSGGKLIIVDFGKTRYPVLYRFLTFWEPYKYLRGNLTGLITQFMSEAGFQQIQEDKLRWPIIHLFTATKP